MAKLTAKDIEKQVDALREKAARSTNLCLTGSYIALRDARVREVFLKKITEGNVFDGIECDKDQFEQVVIIFNFRCPDGVICLIPPTFAAVIDLIGGQVIRIIDPYYPLVSTAKPAAASSGFSVGN